MKKQLTYALIGMALGLTSSQVQAAERIKMATIAPGTSAYLTMTTFARMVNQGQDKVEIQVDATGAATKHQIELAQGKLDMCMSSPTIFHFMKKQKAMYKKLSKAPELSKKVRLVMWFPYGQYHAVTYAADNIRTLQDIRGKKVFLGPPGGGAWAASRNWIRSTTGMKPGEDYKVVKASWSSALQGFQDRQYDVYISGGIAPYPLIEQLSLTSKLHLLGQTKEEFDKDETFQKYLKSLPGREIGIIPAGSYGDNVDNKSDIYTNAAVVGISVRDDISDDAVYAMTKAFWVNVEAERATSPWMKRVTLDYAVQEGGMALHPGAQRYYEEVGVKIPDGSKAK